MKRRMTFLILGAGIIIGIGLSAVAISNPSRLLAWISQPQRPFAQSSSPATGGNPPDQQKELQQKIDTLKEKLDPLKDRLDGYSKQADDLQRLLTILVGFSTIYAGALALNSLKEAKESDQKLHDLLKEAQEATDEVWNTLPLLSDINHKFKVTVAEMIALLPTMDESDHAYNKLLPEEREQILFYEKTFAAAEYFNLAGFRTDTSKIYQGLGSFYARAARNSRRESDKSADPPEKMRLTKAYKEHLERARFYLRKAVEQDPGNTGALNDCAYLELVIAVGNDQQWDEAEHFCKMSLEKDPNQQRARYNLVWLKLTHTGDYATSVQLFREALDKPVWQQTETPRRIAEIFYNKACGLVHLARASKVAEVRSRCLDEAMKDLEEAFNRPDRDNVTLSESFCGDDSQPEGDLGLLGQEKAARFQLLLDKVCGTKKLA
jgi:hypothetical protein